MERWKSKAFVRIPAGVVRPAVAGFLALACAGGSQAGPAGRGSAPATRSSGLIPQPLDAIQVYRQMGLLADNGPVPYVGSVAFLAGPTLDSTAMLVSLSIASRSLEFKREGDAYRAGYRVNLELRHDSTVVRRVNAVETVRVAAFKETTRGDESVIFQQALYVPPGQYTMQLTVTSEDPTRTAAPLTADVTVPRLSTGGLSSPVAFYDVTLRSSSATLPRIIPTPRATVVFGRDTTLPVYIEAYGAGPRIALGVGVQGEQRISLWTDSAVVLQRPAGAPAGSNLLSGIVNVPVSRLGIGVTSLAVWRYDSPDTVRVPIFITFGEDLPVATLEQMISYLRFYANPVRLRTLRDTTPEARAKLWSKFIHETDPNPDTPEHEGLRDYFHRIQLANVRFHDEGGAGWLTDRGSVYVTLGEPDQILEPQGVAMTGDRGRIQVWEFRQHRLALQFVDQSGFGRWRLTTSSQADFQNMSRRVWVGG